MTTKLAVLSDCTLFRAGMESVVTVEPSLSVVGAAGCTDALDMLEAAHVDLIVVDHSMDGAVGLCRTITKRYPGVPVLMISGLLQDDVVRGSVEAGASGFVYKDVEPGALRSTVALLASGQSVLDPRVTGRVIGWAAARNGVPEAEADEALSDREIDVLRLAARGEPNKRIARLLGLSPNTVKTYLRRAYDKLGCNSRSAASVIATQRGLI